MVSWLVEMLVHGPPSKWLSWRGMKKSNSSSERARKNAFHLNTLYILTVSWNVNSVVRWLLIHFDFSFYRLKKFYYIEMVLFLAFFFPLLILCEAKLIAFFLSWVKWNEQRKKRATKRLQKFRLFGLLQFSCCRWVFKLDYHFGCRSFGSTFRLWFECTHFSVRKSDWLPMRFNRIEKLAKYNFKYSQKSGNRLVLHSKCPPRNQQKPQKTHDFIMSLVDDEKRKMLTNSFEEEKNVELRKNGKHLAEILMSEHQPPGKTHTHTQISTQNLNVIFAPKNFSNLQFRNNN